MPEKNQFYNQACERKVNNISSSSTRGGGAGSGLWCQRGDGSSHLSLGLTQHP